MMAGGNVKGRSHAVLSYGCGTAMGDDAPARRSSARTTGEHVLMNAILRFPTGKAMPLADASPIHHELDEAGLFSQAQAEFLAGRGLIYLTDMQLGDERFATIVAENYAQAVRIAQQRGCGEKVIGLMGRSFLHNIKMRMLAQWQAGVDGRRNHCSPR